LRIGPAYEAGLGAGMRRERVSPPNKKERKKERKSVKKHITLVLGITLANVDRFCWTQQ